MKTTYSTKEPSELTGASRQIIRSYTSTYAAYFSTEGAPDQPGPPRNFTPEDLRLIRFIYVMTKQRGQNHSQVLERLKAGELAEFDWDLPDDVEEEPGTAVVSIAQLQAARLLLEDAQHREVEAQRREQEAIVRAEEQARRLQEQSQQRERELQEQINQLLRELGHKEGELEALRTSKPKGFWARLLGRGE